MAESVEEKISAPRMVALILLALFSLACLIAGGAAYITAIESWVDHGYVFRGFEVFDWLFGLIGATIIAVGLVVAGVALRLLRLRYAPLSSLLLSIAAAGFLIATFLIYSHTGNGENSIEIVLLQGLCILGLFVIALPPFLHWLLARRRTPIALKSPNVP